MRKITRMLTTTITRTAAAAAIAIGVAGAPAATAADGKLLIKEVLERGKLRALVTSNVPYSYKEPGETEWKGYVVDLVTMLAKEMKVELELVESNWATLIPSLTAGKADVIFAPMFMTIPRGQLMSLTDPVAFSGGHIIVRADETRFKSYDDFNDKSVVFAMFPNASETMGRNAFPHATIKIISGDNPNAPRMEVLAGRADASVTDKENAEMFAKANPRAKVFPGAPFTAKPIVWGVRPEDSHFRDFLNVFILDKRTSGVIKNLGEKYNLQVEF